MSPKAKKIGRTNYEELAKSSLLSHRVQDEAGTGSDLDHIKEQIRLTRRELKQKQVKNNSLKKNVEIAKLTGQLQDNRNFIYNSQG